MYKMLNMSQKFNFIFDELCELGKEHYLQDKLTNFNNSNQNEYGEYFWKNIQRFPSNIPECTRCTEDTKKFFNALTNNREKEFKPDCSKYCLWYKWFEYKRNKKFMEKSYVKLETKLETKLESKSEIPKDIIEKSKISYAKESGNLYGLMLEREDEIKSDEIGTLKNLGILN